MHHNTKRLNFAFFVLFTIGTTYAQEYSEIQSWIIAHPNVTLIEQAIFQRFTEEQTTKLNQPYLVFNEPLTIDQLNHYEQWNQNSTEEERNDAEQIKFWLSNHQSLKQIKHSEFKNLRNEDQEFYLNDAHSIVLAGEKISLIDIKNYETNHSE